jgi:hypothetical protein
MYFHFVGSVSENALLRYRAGLPGRIADNLRGGAPVKRDEHLPRNARATG